MLHAFRDIKGGGVYPQARLVNVNGTLYGTTTSGGAYGHGTFYSITTTRTEQVLYSFGKRPDAADPSAGLINVNGRLYGTAAGGGRYRGGTVYSITTTGTEKVLYSFGGPGDGATPLAPLVNVKGTLYGTTYFGGSTGCGSRTCGTIFSVSTTGNERLLHRFAGGSDGAEPSAGLLDVNGTLYGTTTGVFGGMGTVFSVTAAGKERVLHRFGGGSDGLVPDAGLVDVDGTLYGTTANGGASNHGTVFSVTTSGRERVLYSFTGEPDGSGPEAKLIDANHTLYGTTTYGGTYSPRCDFGCGTIFSVTTTGAEEVVHTFAGAPADGSKPLADLIDVKGTLYGTTDYGGPRCNHRGGLSGCGTVFAFTP
ncbi:MAG: hypothetical protein JO003_00250 [Candidatus Eremiobacteraeota bacterium]|nr:hypothetical protein [Candidatus Eremiobacteraeota bacterium]